MVCELEEEVHLCNCLFVLRHQQQCVLVDVTTPWMQLKLIKVCGQFSILRDL